ncbi:MAG: glycosyltransferase family 39 protein [Pirellulales bacterium]|nr:glycosyltransferase family 39 protein [Pirellulales bacterium]
MALLLRAQHIGTRSLWFDEAFTWRLAGLPISELLSRAVLDHNPPLYYLVLHGWMALTGDSPAMLRLPSVVGGALAVLTGAWLAADVARQRSPGSRAYAARAALLAALLLALNATQIRWGSEVRMYSLGTLLALLSTAVLLRALHAQRRAWLWPAYAACMAAMLYTHTYGVFSWLAHALYLAAQAARDACVSRLRPLAPATGAATVPARPSLAGLRLIHAISAGMAAMALYAPWLPVLLAQRARVQQDFWTRPVTGSYVLATTTQVCLTSEFAVPRPADSRAGGCLLAMSLAALVWRGRSGEWAVAASAVVPLAASVLVSAAGTRVLAPHYLIFAQAHMLVGLALVLARARLSLDFAAVVAIATAAMLVQYLNAQQVLRIEAAPGARGAAWLIDQQRSPGEPVVVCTPLYYLPIVYHLSDREHVYVHRPSQGWPRYHGTAVLTETDEMLPETLSRLAPGRVWVVDMQGGGWGECRLRVPEAWKRLAEHRLREVYPMQGEVVVRVYAVPAGSAVQPGGPH